MKKITNLLIVASLALAGAVMAQQPTPEESQAPTTKKEAPGKKPRAEKPAMTQAPKTETPKTEAPKTEAPPLKEPTLKEPPAPPKMEKTEKKGPSNRKSVTPATTPDTTKAPTTYTDPPATPATTPATKKQQSSRKDKKAPEATAST